MKRIKKVLPYIRRLILRKFLKDFIHNDYDQIREANTLKLPCMHAQSFGQKHADKNFYIIWRKRGGAGFFSNLSFVICHLKIAEDLGMIPVVDFENFKTIYNEPHAINGSHNAWEYYFKQVSQFSIAEIYQSKNVFFCDGEFHSDIWNNIIIATTAGYKIMFNRYISLQAEVVDKIACYEEKLDETVLAIHFRGKEMNLAASHPFGPTVKQMFKFTDMLLNKYNLKKILVVTEEKDYLDLFISKYGDKIIYTDSFCIPKINAYKIYPRTNHKYLLGLEVLRDTLLLAKCGVMLCSASNVSETARLLGNHRAIYSIDNGMNSKNVFIARYLYKLKKLLPASFGGLSGNLIEKHNSNN